jgi:hypothetical protein
VQSDGTTYEGPRPVCATATDQPYIILGAVAAIDASSFDRVAASRRYATRTKYQFRSLKMTLLVGCLTRAISTLTVQLPAK